MRVQLIRIHEEGTCARWRTDPKDLAVIVVIPAKTRRPKVERVAS